MAHPFVTHAKKKGEIAMGFIEIYFNFKSRKICSNEEIFIDQKIKSGRLQ